MLVACVAIVTIVTCHKAHTMVWPPQATIFTWLGTSDSEEELCHAGNKLLEIVSPQGLLVEACH